MWQEIVSSANFAGTSKLAESVVKTVLLDLGYQERNLTQDLKELSHYKTKKELLDASIKQTSSSNDPFFYYQPLGSQQSPDFFVRHACGENECIEVKAAKSKNSWLFNGHLIRPEFTYVLSDPTTGFCVVQGYEIMDPEVRDILLETDRKLREIAEESRAILDNHPKNPQGWYYYVRAMYSFGKILHDEPRPIFHQERRSA